MLDKKEWYRYLAEDKKLAVMKLCLLVLTVTVLILNLVTDYEYNRVILTFTAFVSMASIITVFVYVRNNWFAVVIIGVIALSMYSAWAECMWSLFFSVEQSLSITYVGMYGMMTLCLFSLAILLCIRRELRKNTKEDSLISCETYNPLIVAGLFGVLVLIFLFGYIRPEVEGARGDITPAYEYSIILFIFAYMYSGNKWYTVLPVTVLLVAFVAQDLIYGGRRTAISLVLLLFFVFISHRYSFIKLLPFAALGYVLFVSVGIFRGGMNLSIEQLKTTFWDIFNNKFAIDTMYSSYYTGLTFIACATEQIFSVRERLSMFASFLASMVVGGGRVENSLLPMITRKYFLHWYGGMFPMYGYFYLGYFGTLLTGVATAFWMKLADRRGKLKNLTKSLIFWMTCTVFAWILYTPSSMIRGSLFVVIGYFACIFGDKISKLCLKKVKSAISKRKPN